MAAYMNIKLYKINMLMCDLSCKNPSFIPLGCQHPTAQETAKALMVFNGSMIYFMQFFLYYIVDWHKLECFNNKLMVLAILNGLGVNFFTCRILCGDALDCVLGFDNVIYLLKSCLVHF